MVKIEDIALREKKYAKTKIDLLNTFYEKLKTQTLEEISVKDLCRETNISYKTFFNYFSKKSDLLIYYSHLWSIDTQFYAGTTLSKCKPLEKIEKIFDYTCDKYDDNFRIVKELVSHMAINSDFIHFEKLKLAEYVIAFPEKDGIEKYKATLVDNILQPYILEAIKNGEISSKTDVKLLMLTLRSIFFGVILSAYNNGAKEVRKTYNDQLKMIWKSIK